MAHPYLDELLNALLPSAQRMLAERGEFFPLGACMKSDGAIELAAGTIRLFSGPGKGAS